MQFGKRERKRTTNPKIGDRNYSRGREGTIKRQFPSSNTRATGRGELGATEMTVLSAPEQGVQTYRQSKRNKNGSIIFMTLNAQSLVLKIDDLKLNADLHKPLIIGVTETWGYEDLDEGTFKLENYTMYRSDRIGRRGGGTILYVNTKLGQRECTAMKRPVRGIPFENSSWCWVTPTRGKKILVGCIYRSTSSPEVNNNRLNELIRQANEVAGGNRLLIMGDFNVPNIDWINNITLPRARILERDFFDTVSDNFLN